MKIGPISLSPDGRYYLRAAAGQPVPSPYGRRWLLPVLLGPFPERWAILTWASLIGTPTIAWIYFGAVGLEGGSRIFAALLLSALPGVWRCPLRFPVLLDAPSFALALAVAALAAGGHPWLAAALSLPLGAMRESSPLFAALWAWSPAPFLGLVAVGWRVKTAPPDAPWLSSPIREAWALRKRIGLDGSLYLLPWGGALAGLVAWPSIQLGVTLAAAHAQLIMAQDTIRLAAWAGPVLVMSAAKAIPPAWWAVAILVTVLQRDERV